VREEIDGPVALSAVLSNTFHAARAVTRGAPFRLPSPLKNPANVTVSGAKVSCWFSKVSLKDRSCRGVPYHAESTLSRSAQMLKLPSFVFQNSFLSSLCTWIMFFFLGVPVLVPVRASKPSVVPSQNSFFFGRQDKCWALCRSTWTEMRLTHTERRAEERTDPQTRRLQRHSLLKTRGLV